MHCSLGNNYPLPRGKSYSATSEIDEQFAFHDVEEFVVVGMLVPIDLPLYHPETDDAVVYLTECLAIQLVRACVGESLLVYHLKGLVVQICLGNIRVVLLFRHRSDFSRLNIYAFRREARRGGPVWGFGKSPGDGNLSLYETF
jgi:hypothetical protein